MWTTLKAYSDTYPWPGPKTIRWTVWKIEKGLGKEPCFIRRVGKRMLIDGERFQQWIDSEEARLLTVKWKKVKEKSIGPYEQMDIVDSLTAIG